MLKDILKYFLMDSFYLYISIFSRNFSFLRHMEKKGYGALKIPKRACSEIFQIFGVFETYLLEDLLLKRNILFSLC